MSQSVVLNPTEGALEHLNRVVHIFLAIVILEVADALKVVVIRTGDLSATRFLFGALGETLTYSTEGRANLRSRLTSLEGRFKVPSIN